MKRPEVVAAILVIILLGILGYFVLNGQNTAGSGAVAPQTNAQYASQQ